jgi:DNA polymerase III subunit chi
LGEVRFYHLTALPLERVLPTMLERTLSRGQRAVVRGGLPERLGWLDRELWAWNDESFLPHGIDGDPDPHRHPVWLTSTREIPNGAAALFLVDGAGAATDEMAAMEVTAVLFDGHDPAAVEAARAQWRCVTGAGLSAVYWAQEGGRWVKKHESGGRKHETGG